jgi:hypothetical protein
VNEEEEAMRDVEELATRGELRWSEFVRKFSSTLHLR